jgi:hypothetical protein
MEEAGVPGENHRPWASNWYTLSLAAILFCYVTNECYTLIAQLVVMHRNHGILKSLRVVNH